MRILLLCSSFNGLSQRAWIELRAAEHEVDVRLAGEASTIVTDVRSVDPDLIICPFLRHRVPREVWEQYRTIIIHPGPPGDRGPSSLDWAISERATRWGVTALQAVEEMDAGPIWASRCFDMPVDPPRKSSLYNGPVADAAIELVHEVVAKAESAGYTGRPLDDRDVEVWGTLRPAMRRADRAFSWSDRTDEIVRRVRAGDGSPGVDAELCGVPAAVFDASPGPALTGEPGSVAGRRHGAVLVRTGDGGVWIGHIRRPIDAGGAGVKLAAADALADRLGDVPQLLQSAIMDSPEDITYRRLGAVGELRFDFYNGAMSTRQCRRLLVALRRAIADDTRVLVIGGGESFSNGIHLNVIHVATDPAGEAWRNIVAIDDVCREIIACTNKLVVSSVSGNAGAGGVMMALGADRVVVRDGVVLNPHYRTMGLFGSEYWTYTLPRRVGFDYAQELTERCLPIGSAEAVATGLADVTLAGTPQQFAAAVTEYATELAARPDFELLLRDKQRRRADDERRRPLDAYRVEELAEMSRDIFDDRNGFAAARRAFVMKQPARSTPDHLVAASRTERHDRPMEALPRRTGS